MKFELRLVLLPNRLHQLRPDSTHLDGMLYDKVTAQRLVAALKRAGQDLANDRADSTNGIVSSSGTVTPARLRSPAEDIARSLLRIETLKKDVQSR